MCARFASKIGRVEGTTAVVRPIQPARARGTRSAHGGGWLWELNRGTQTAQVVVEISPRRGRPTLVSSPNDTRQALETDGRTEIIKMPETHIPPRVIRCDSQGCAPHRG